MNEYMLCMLTAQGCGHCHFLRGDGKLNNGSHLMKYDFLKKICEKMNIYNIHYNTMRGLNEDIKEITKITLFKDNIIHDKFYNEKNSTKLTRTYSNKPEENLQEIDKHWKEFIKEKIVSKLSNYTYYFPCFIVMKTSDWNKCLKILDHKFLD